MWFYAFALSRGQSYEPYNLHILTRFKLKIVKLTHWLRMNVTSSAINTITFDTSEESQPDSSSLDQCCKRLLNTRWKLNRAFN